MSNKPKLILFDLLTALMDSWTIWEEAAGDKKGWPQMEV